MSSEVNSITNLVHPMVNVSAMQLTAFLERSVPQLRSAVQPSEASDLSVYVEDSVGYTNGEEVF